jgi:hypothetical protein
MFYVKMVYIFLHFIFHNLYNINICIYTYVDICIILHYTTQEATVRIQ